MAASVAAILLLAQPPKIAICGHAHYPVSKFEPTG